MVWVSWIKPIVSPLLSLISWIFSIFSHLQVESRNCHITPRLALPSSPQERQVLIDVSFELIVSAKKNCNIVGVEAFLLKKGQVDFWDKSLKQFPINIFAGHSVLISMYGECLFVSNEHWFIGDGSAFLPQQPVEGWIAVRYNVNKVKIIKDLKFVTD